MNGTNTPREPLPPLNYAALADALLSMADDLVAQWLPGGARRGHEYVCGSLAGGKGSSCSVNLVNGQWADFASEERGHDLLSLYAKAHGLTMAKACVELARQLGLEQVAGVVMAADGKAPPLREPRPAPPPKPAPDRENWRAIAPVPGYAPKVNFKHQHRTDADIVHVSEYWRGSDLFGYVVRFRTSDGGKDDIARTWCESQTKGGARWHWKQWEEPRPLYLPGRTLPDGRTVVLVEGASACSDATEDLRQLADKRKAAAAPARAAAASTAQGLQQRADYTLGLQPKVPGDMCASMQALGDEWLKGRAVK